MPALPRLLSIGCSLLTLLSWLHPPIPAQAPAGDVPAEKIIISGEEGEPYFFAPAAFNRPAPVVNARGTTVFVANDVATGNWSVILQRPGRAREVLFTSGFGVPGFPPDHYVVFGAPALNDKDDVAVPATYSGPLGPDGLPTAAGALILFFANGGPPERRLETTEPNFGYDEVLLNNSGDLCYIGSGPVSLNDESSIGIYVAYGGTFTEKVIGVYEALPGAGPGEGYYPVQGLATTGERHVCFVDDLGNVAFLSSHTRGANGVWLRGQDGLVKVVANLDLAPGLGATFFENIDGLHMNGQGDMVISATLTNSVRSIWHADQLGNLRLVARSGQQLATDAGDFVGVHVAGAIQIASTGAIPFVAGLAQPHHTLGIVEAVLLWKPDGTYTYVAGNADSAPGLPAGYFTSFRDAVANGEDQVLFSAAVSTLHRGVYVASPGSTPALVASGGATLRYGPGAGDVTRAINIVDLRRMDLSQPYWDRWVQLGDGGHVVIAAEWRRTWGLFRISPPYSTLIVNSPGDRPDRDLTDGACDTGETVLNVDGDEFVPECTLRAAIEEANAAPDTTRIHFGMNENKLRIIEPSSPLPVVLHPVEIDGFTQPGSMPTLPYILLDGRYIQDSNMHGLVVAGGHSLVRGLAIARFFSHGVYIRNGGNNIVAGCLIGTDGLFQPGLGNRSAGIMIEDSAGNVIGAPFAGNLWDSPEANFVMSNGFGGTVGCGIEIKGPNAGGNTVWGNVIGDGDLGNHWGVCIEDGAENRVGGGEGEGNWIFNSLKTGVLVRSALADAGANVIEGNWIGHYPDGTPAPETQDGVFIDDALDTEVRDNSIAGLGRHGVRIVGGRNTELRTLIAGNRILPQVTPDAGPMLTANAGDGIVVQQAASNVIGGLFEEDANVISRNGLNGIRIDGPLSTANVVIGNLIGTGGDGLELTLPQATADQLLPSGNGILITGGAARNQIGMLDAGNWISGNALAGVRIESSQDADNRHTGDTRKNRIEGNVVGLDVQGNALGNGHEGVAIHESPDNAVGGGEDSGNTISSNSGTGVAVRGELSSANRVQGNWIGTGLDGVTGRGNGRHGIEIALAQATLIGGVGPAPGQGEGNVIAANRAFGIALLGTEASGDFVPLDTVVQGNRIGLQVPGDPLGNGLGGVLIRDASLNRVGPMNRIAANGGPGVEVSVGRSFGATGNTVTESSILDNAGLGIDLGGDGATANDSLDADSGPNELQNFPELVVTTGGAGHDIEGTLQSEPGRRYRIELFDNPAPALPAAPETAAFVAAVELETDAQGRGRFELRGLHPSQCFTATATELGTGSTSEVSSCAQEVEALLDFGDAPDPPYPTLLASSGASHRIVPGFHLGAAVDAETPLVTFADASGDDSGSFDDEDGVELAEPLRAGEAGTLRIVVSREGRLDAWIDFNADGDWDDQGEHVAASLLLAAGASDVQVEVPAGAVPGLAAGRFRLSSAGGLQPTGVAPDGEVEDHLLAVESPSGPTFRRGDTDANRALEITDAIQLLAYLFLGGEEPSCPDAADADDNGQHEITDAIVILGYLFLGTAAPPAPGPDACGPDGTVDGWSGCQAACP